MDREEAEALLNEFNKRLEQQGNVVDGRLLQKRDNLKKQLANGEYD